jgi:Mg-chelatase subunit ChlD/TolB-like protein
MFKNLIYCLLFFLFINCSSSNIKLETPSDSSAPNKDKKTEMNPSKNKPSKTSKVSEEDKGGAYDKEEIYPSSKPSIPTAIPSESGLKAGFADDNKQYNYFIEFLEKFSAKAIHLNWNVSERIIFKVVDSAGLSISNVGIEIKENGKLIETGKTYSDGTYLFFPSEYSGSKFTIHLSKDSVKKEIQVDRQGNRNYTIELDVQVSREKIPVDVLFILDTTASMGKEIERLRNTIELIHLNLSEANKGYAIKFGMVLYKDKGDEYNTKVIDLTDDIEKFRNELSKIYASGGGDIPEDLQSALKDSIKEISWTKNSLKLSFIITDAAPHLDYKQSFNYIEAGRSAKAIGLKYYTIGTGGLDIHGEYVLRQLSQYTYSKYIFLTYGEKGESDGGKAGSVSHHTGDNFPTDKLESIIIRFAKEEIANVRGKPYQKEEEYFSAKKINTEKKETTLSQLFDKSIQQLVDYSSTGISEGTTTALVPFQVENKTLLKNAEYFSEQALLSFTKNKKFKIVERKDLQKVLTEWKLNLQAIEEQNAIKVGKLLGAKYLVIGRIYLKNNNYEVYLKLVHSETGEVNSATKLIIEKGLGL